MMQSKPLMYTGVRQSENKGTQTETVLMKGDKLLPLKEKRINVFGDAYYRFYNMSGGAGSINPRYSIGFVEGLEKYGNFELNPELLHFFTDGFGTVPDKDMIERAKEYSDTAVITVSRGSKEATDNNPDKGGYYLTDEEEQLIKNVTAMFENTIAILNVGWQIDVRWIEKYNVKALLWFGYAGQSAGQALADVLSGKVSPSGHLPDTWAYDYYDYPSAKNFITNDDIEKTCDKPLVENVYEEGIYVGYRYFDTSYEEAEKNPSLLDSFVAQMSVEELARICVCAQAWAIDSFGVAGSVYPVEKYKMKHFLAADGNTTVRMSKRMTGFPSSNMICASFNREMSYAVGRVIAEEAHEEKIHLILAPGINIHRNPLCGRNAEYFSEDVVLSGVMAGYMTKGLQDNKVAACLKHIVANNAELSRKRSNSVMSERTLREIYVRNFEIAMQTEMPDSIMTSYNALNNKYTATDEELMIGIFREELGFCGYIMTDWESYETVDWVEAVNAGNCWITPGSPDDKYTKPIVSGAENGSVNVDRLRENVRYHVGIMTKYTRMEKQ